MKYLILTLAFLAAFWYLDHAYNRELEDHYGFTKWVIESYCQPNVLKQKGIVK